MSKLLKDNRLPIAISGTALLVATIIGIVPVVQNSRGDTEADARTIAALQDRLAALENGNGAPAAGAASDIPENAGNARLRQEIDLITKGLANQTGRVSRLKSSVEGIVDDSGALIPSTRVMDEIALAKRGLANLTRRINALEDRMEMLDSAAGDIARLQQQMANVDQAFLRISKNARDAKAERENLAATLSNQPSAATATGGPDINDIQTKLDAILQALQN